MAISWGPYDDHLRVGIDVSYTTPSAGSSTVTVTIKYYIGGDGWGFDDTQYLNYSGDYSGGQTEYYNSGQTQLLVKTVTQTVSVSYGSTTSRTYTAKLSGAYNGAAPSKTVSISIPRRPYGTPSTPGSPLVSSISTGSARLSWTNPSDWGGSGENRYRVYYEQVGGGGDTVTTANRYLDIAPATPGGTYRFRVQAYNDNLGNGGGSSSWSGWTTWTNPPNPPSVPRSVALSNVLSTSMRATWASPSDWGGQSGSYEYQLRIGTTVVKALAPASSPVDFTGLTPGETYKFRVRAYNDGGESSYVEVSATLPAGPQQAPVLSLANAGPIGARLTWTGITNWGAENGTYTLKYGTDAAWASGQTTWVANLSGAVGARAYTIPVTLRPNTTYYAQVKGVNSFGDGPDSNVVQWNTSAPPVYIKVAGTWRTASALYVKVGGTWRSVVRLWVKAAGVWR